MTELLPSRALERARALDEHLARNPSKPVGPLHGLPISVKGSIAFKDLRMHTGWVSWWDKDTPDEDALVIEILENAGAVFHARTTVPQGMMQLETQSNLFGTTTNPFSGELSSGGSSGGEAALIALGGSVLGIGSDIGGMSLSTAFQYPSFCSASMVAHTFKAVFASLPQLVVYTDSNRQRFEYLPMGGTASHQAQIQFLLSSAPSAPQSGAQKCLCRQC